jgi:hypothetical protein
LANNLPDLPAFHHPTNECACHESDRECCCDIQHRVPLNALGCVINEFFCSVATLFCGTLDYSYAVLDCVSNRAGGARSLVSRFGDMLSRSVQYCL